MGLKAIVGKIIAQVLNDNFSYLNESLSEKANQSDVNAQIAALAGDSPKGIFATLADLQIAFPTGATGKYIVGTAGGEKHWYIWWNSQWVDGGIYQGIGITDKSVTLSALADDVASPFVGKKVTEVPSQVAENQIAVLFSVDATAINLANAVIDVTYDVYSEDSNVRAYKTKLFTSSSPTAVGIPSKISSETLVKLNTIQSLSFLGQSFTADDNYLQVYLWAMCNDSTKQSIYYYKNVVIKINGQSITPTLVQLYSATSGSIQDITMTLSNQLVTQSSLQQTLSIAKDNSVKTPSVVDGAIIQSKLDPLLFSDFNGFKASQTSAVSGYALHELVFQLPNGYAMTDLMKVIFDFVAFDPNIIAVGSRIYLNNVVTAGGSASGIGFASTFQSNYIKGLLLNYNQIREAIGSTANTYAHVYIYIQLADSTKAIEYYARNGAFYVGNLQATLIDRSVKAYSQAGATLTTIQSLPTRFATYSDLDNKVPTMIDSNITAKTVPYNGYKVVAKTNTVNPTKVQISFAFDISGLGLVNGDSFTFAIDVMSDDSNIIQLASQYFFNNNGTPGGAASGIQLFGATIPYTTPKKTYSFTGSISDSTSKYIHCFLNIIVSDNTKAVTFSLNNIKLTLKGIVYPFISNIYGLYSANSSDVVSFIQYLDSQIALISYVNSLLTGHNINNLYGKVLNILGDSMVHGHTLGFSKTWAYKLGQRNGMTVRDYGINGTCLAGTSNAYGASMATRYTSMDNNADFVGVFGLTNDQVAGIPIGTDNDNTVDTVKGALNILCSGLQTKYPNAKIFFITPYHRSGRDSTYADAMIAICEGKYGIPVFDNYRKGGICWDNAAQVTALTMNDTYHLNEPGQQYASTKYEAFMNAL